MNDNEFWLKVWKWITITICLIAILSFSHCQHNSYRDGQMMKKLLDEGINPSEAACLIAISNGITPSASCNLYVFKSYASKNDQ